MGVTGTLVRERRTHTQQLAGQRVDASQAPVLQPLPATAEAIEQLAAFGDETTNDRLRRVAKAVLDMVPASALSIWFVDENLTLTMIDKEGAVNPGTGEPPFHTMRSSLALHIAAETRLTSIVTVYSRYPRAFTGRVSWIEHAVGAVPATSVLNDDLDFRSRLDAELAPAQIRTRQTVDRALGYLLGQGLDLDEAERWLTQDAQLAALTPFEMARLILDEARGTGRPHDSPPARPSPVR